MEFNARSAALEALERCTKSGAWSGAAIDNVIRRSALEGREASLASRLCLGVLQNISYCDYCIGLFYNKSVDKLESKVLNILRLGAYQLLFLDKIPARAAVNETVELSRQCGCNRASGLINAIMRKMAAREEAFPDVPGKGSASYLSTRYSHPIWLVKRIIELHGYDFAESYLEKNNGISKLSIQINRLKVNTQDYLKALERKDICYSLIDGLDGCVILDGGKVNTLPGFEEGLFYVQDPAARIAVEAAGLKPGMTVLDACSAPGGKSFAAAISMGNSGSITSCDIHEKKLSLIRSGAERLGIDIIQSKARDAREDDEALHEYFDAVIADVPCSGLGVIGKKPEIRNKNEAELMGLPTIQRDILNNLSSFVKHGGTLLYSTCTILPEENEKIVEEFLKSHSDFYAEDFLIGPVSSTNAMYTFWPNVDDTDGFFAARLRRK